MNRIILILLFLTISLSALPAAIPSDSLVRFSELEFNSEIERKAFKDFNNNSSALKLFLSIDTAIDAAEMNSLVDEFESIYSELWAKNIDAVDVQNKVELIAELVNSRYKLSFDPTGYLPDLMREGRYSCLSYVIFYDLLFTRLKIPHVIMKSKDHLYLVANPGANSFVFEAENPVLDPLLLSLAYKKKYVRELKKAKDISDIELKSRSVSEIFGERYHGAEQTSIGVLAGMHYFQKSLEMLEKNDYVRAYHLAQKAWYFYQNDEIEDLMSKVLIVLMENAAYKKLSDVDLIARFSRLSFADDNMTKDIFNRAISKHEDDPEHCSLMLSRFSQTLDDPALASEVAYAYNLRMASKHIGTTQADLFFQEAYRIKPEQRELVTKLISHFDKLIKGYSTPLETLSTVKQASKTYGSPALIEMFQYYLIVGNLQAADQALASKKYDSAEIFLNDFEALGVNEFENEGIYELIAKVYRALAVHFYYKGNASKAKEIVDRGLVYVPDNAYLRSVVY